ncbi:MAG: FAD binding domain-containing protein [Planctomycetota bacterium]|jgi:CO/xanthine dehydrogenase FAD-binding subunit
MTAVEQYLAPLSVQDATKALAQGHVSVFAGGTDLMVQTRLGARAFRPVLMNICRIRGLRGIEKSDGHVWIGTLTTITDILVSDLLKSVAGVLVHAADCFASPQVRNSATVGGNICNASPAADMIIPLLVLDAEVELASWEDGSVVSRTVALDELFVGPGETTMAAHELLTSVRFPAPQAGTVAVFAKCGARPALDIALASVGVAGVKRNGTLRGARVAFGAVAPTPIRGRRTEAALEGAVLDDSRIADIARTAEQEIAPISDVRASAWYRTRLIHDLTRKLLRNVSRTQD